MTCRFWYFYCWSPGSRPMKPSTGYHSTSSFTNVSTSIFQFILLNSDCLSLSVYIHTEVRTRSGFSIFIGYIILNP